jgi:hypothetical protein
MMHTCVVNRCAHDAHLCSEQVRMCAHLCSEQARMCARLWVTKPRLGGKVEVYKNESF